MTSLTFFLIFIPILALLLLTINYMLANHLPNKYKDSQFECGFFSFSQMSRLPFSILFFVYALLFLLFDLEILLVYPFIVSSYNGSLYTITVFLIFIFILIIGFTFELGRKALNLDTKPSKLKDYIVVYINPYTDISHMCFMLFINPPFLYMLIFNILMLILRISFNSLECASYTENDIKRFLGGYTTHVPGGDPFNSIGDDHRYTPDGVRVREQLRIRSLEYCYPRKPYIEKIVYTDPKGKSKAAYQGSSLFMLFQGSNYPFNAIKETDHIFRYREYNDANWRRHEKIMESQGVPVEDWVSRYYYYLTLKEWIKYRDNMILDTKELVESIDIKKCLRYHRTAIRLNKFLLRVKFGIVEEDEGYESSVYSSINGDEMPMRFCKKLEVKLLENTLARVEKRLNE